MSLNVFFYFQYAKLTIPDQGLYVDDIAVKSGVNSQTLGEATFIVTVLRL